MENNSQNPINHVVVMMFENRSFDHILGDMPNVNGLFDANGVLKPDIYNSTNPLQPANGAQIPFAIVPGASELVYIPPVDPPGNFNHDFTAMLTDLYGPGTTGVIEGNPLTNPTTTYPPANSGFVVSNDYQTGYIDNKQYAVMSYFQWNSMKVFHTLASEFVVCDNWFCDMPGHTAPNRAFMHCATTGSLGIDDNDAANETYPIPYDPSMVYKPTIFETLVAAGATWKVYWPGANLDTDFLNMNVANEMWTGQDPQQTNCTGVPLTQFCTDVANNNLPFYSFIMCWNDLGANADTSMHPQTPVEGGENLLAGVYNTLRNSPYWADTLLVVNFDENGGIYDHVTPPQTIPPYPGAAPDTWTSNGIVYQFDYSTLGVRIPVLLISPWLNAGVDSTQFQNTSVLRYLQDLVTPPSVKKNKDGLPALFLTERDRNANSIALTFETFGTQQMRTDCIQNVPTYPNNAFDNGICTPITATPEQLAATPPLYLQELTREYIAGLPGHPDSHKPITMHFDTVKEMRAYVAERRTAARAYYQRILRR